MTAASVFLLSPNVTAAQPTAFAIDTTATMPSRPIHKTAPGLTKSKSIGNCSNLRQGTEDEDYTRGPVTNLQARYERSCKWEKRKLPSIELTAPTPSSFARIGSYGSSAAPSTPSSAVSAAFGCKEGRQSASTSCGSEQHAIRYYQSSSSNSPSLWSTKALQNLKPPLAGPALLTNIARSSSGSTPASAPSPTIFPDIPQQRAGLLPPLELRPEGGSGAELAMVQLVLPAQQAQGRGIQRKSQEGESEQTRTTGRFCRSREEKGASGPLRTEAPKALHRKASQDSSNVVSATRLELQSQHNSQPSAAFPPLDALRLCPDTEPSQDSQAVEPPGPAPSLLRSVPLLPRQMFADEGSYQSHCRVAEWLAQPEERRTTRHSFSERSRRRRRGVSEPRNVSLINPPTAIGVERTSPGAYRRNTRSTVLPPLLKKLSCGQMRKKT